MGHGFFTLKMDFSGGDIVRNGRKRPSVLDVPEIRALLKGGYKWMGNFYDEDQISEDFYEAYNNNVVVTKAYSPEGEELPGEIAVWAPRDLVELDARLTEVLEDAKSQVEHYRDLIAYSRRLGVNIDLKLKVILSVDTETLPGIEFKS